ncbi:hypothetical protein [Egicoccus halophilus]|uniref:Uncharacterized protein n=1 Tax=Egicoccus halophilus TaxID=1670830 RepID=A0A8J3AH20_9ACTN|nr:hypothetical protein [Egicoccus halophilus]GGI09517.1 hypothetical protein GCM10011354_34480 [Egicoccus halophilus]
MEHLLVVAGVLATATFATGVLLPVLARREASDDARAEVHRSLTDELSAGRPGAVAR